jgi:hypothetical protein
MRELVLNCEREGWKSVGVKTKAGTGEASGPLA